MASAGSPASRSRSARILSKIEKVTPAKSKAVCNTPVLHTSRRSAATVTASDGIQARRKARVEGTPEKIDLGTLGKTNQSKGSLEESKTDSLNVSTTLKKYNRSKKSQMTIKNEAHGTEDKCSVLEVCPDEPGIMASTPKLPGCKTDEGSPSIRRSVRPRKSKSALELLGIKIKKEKTDDEGNYGKMPLQKRRKTTNHQETSALSAHIISGKPALENKTSAQVREKSAHIAQKSAQFAQNSAKVAKNSAKVAQNSAKVAQNSTKVAQNSAICEGQMIASLPPQGSVVVLPAFPPKKDVIVPPPGTNQDVSVHKNSEPENGNREVGEEVNFTLQSGHTITYMSREGISSNASEQSGEYELIVAVVTEDEDDDVTEAEKHTIDAQDHVVYETLQNVQNSAVNEEVVVTASNTEEPEILRAVPVVENKLQLEEDVTIAVDSDLFEINDGQVEKVIRLADKDYMLRVDKEGNIQLELLPAEDVPTAPESKSLTKAVHGLPLTTTPVLVTADGMGCVRGGTRCEEEEEEDGHAALDALVHLAGIAAQQHQELKKHDERTRSQNRLTSRRGQQIRSQALVENAGPTAEPITNEDAAKEICNPNTGRRKPTKQIVMFATLQQMLDELKPRDSMENHVTSLRDIYQRRVNMMCKYCNQFLKDRHHFRKHIITHRGVDYKPWECPICDYKSLIKAGIARHINIHSQIQPYTCNICGKSFNFKQKLQLHMKYHQDIRDHFCTECDSRFHEFKTLRNHLTKIHGIINPRAFIKANQSKKDQAKVKTVQLKRKKPNFKVRPIVRNTQLAVKKEKPDKEAETQRQKIRLTESESGTFITVIRSEPTETEKVEQEENDVEESEEFEIDFDAIDVNAEEDVTTSTDVVQSPAKISPSNHSTRPSISDGDQGQKQYKLLKEVYPPKENVLEAAAGSGKKPFMIKMELPDGTEVSDQGTAVAEDAEEEADLDAEADVDNESTQAPSSGDQIRKDQKSKKQDVEVSASDATAANKIGPKISKDSRHGFQNSQLGRLLHIDTASGELKYSRLVNNQRVLSHDQLEPCLQQYCTVEEWVAGSKAVFQCRVCSRLLTSKTQFSKHLERDHPLLKPWKCQLCNFACRLRSSYYVHLKAHEGKKRFECEQCGKGFIFKQKYAEHMKTHSTNKHITCEECGKGFTMQTYLNRHVYRCHSNERPMICDVCGKTFKDQVQLKRHSDTHNDGRKYFCQHCNKFYRSKSSLQQHAKSHSCMFHCEICDKSFGSYSGFMAHKVMHDESFEGYKCTICQRMLHTKGSLNRHMNIAHSDDRPYECEECDKAFKTKKDLKNHEVVHQSAKNYTCTVCAFRCKRIESLRIHMKRHSSIKPYKCGACGKEYTQKNALDIHLRHHSGDLPETCCTCGKGFATKYQLEQHVNRRHKAPSPSEDLPPTVVPGETVTVFMCEECNAVFLSQDSLAVHILAQHMNQGWGGEEVKVKVQEKNADGTQLELLEEEVIQDEVLVSSGDIGLNEDGTVILQQPVAIDVANTTKTNTVETVVTIDTPGKVGRTVTLVQPVEEVVSNEPMETESKAFHHGDMGAVGIAPSMSVLESHDDGGSDDGKMNVDQEVAAWVRQTLVPTGAEREEVGDTFVSITDPNTNEEYMVPVPSTTLENLFTGSQSSHQGDEHHEMDQDHLVAIAETIEVPDVS